MPVAIVKVERPVQKGSSRRYKSLASNDLQPDVTGYSPMQRTQVTQAVLNGLYSHHFLSHTVLVNKLVPCV